MPVLFRLNPAQLRCKALKRCAPIMRLGLDSRFFPAAGPATTQAWLAGLATDMTELAEDRHISRGGFFGFGDVGGECRDSIARPRYGRMANAIYPPPICVTMAHRSHEWTGHASAAETGVFCMNGTLPCTAPVPPPYGDEGAANFMRLCALRMARLGCRDFRLWQICSAAHSLPAST